MKRIILLVLAMSIMCVSFVLVGNAESSITEVTFRIVLEREKVSKLAEANITLCRYTDNTYSSPMQGEYGDIIYRINNIPRESPWQITVKGLPRGYYKIIDVNFSNNWKISFDVDEPCFEVKGDKMTVYIGSPEKGNTVDMPEQWLVYGEDDQNFGIWAEEDESGAESQESGVSYEYSLPPLTNSEDGEVVEEASAISREDASVIEPEQSEGASSSGKSGGVHPGTIVILCLLFVTIIVCGIYIAKQKGRP